jgi:outer membrane receptor protein involved in Fe transport
MKIDFMQDRQVTALRRSGFVTGKTRLACALATVAAVSWHAQPVLAQQGQMLEEIIVTATKRGEQVLQDIPVAVQAVTSDQIRNQVATDFSDLAPQISSLVVQDLGPGDRKYIIRGVNSVATATVGVYYDEAVITARTKQDGGGRQASIELHDMARVEVLKGPQGTLYGASSMSGTVRYVPNAPNSENFEGRIGGTWSDTEDGGSNGQINGMINVPVIHDVLALRAVGWYTDEDGWIDNLLLDNEDINDNEVTGFKLAGEWRVNDDITFTAWGLSQDRDVGGTSREMPEKQALLQSNQELFADDLAAAGFGIPDAKERTTQSYTVTPWDEDLDLYSAKLEWRTDAGRLLGAVSQFERDIDFAFDSTPILLFFGVPVPAVTLQPQEREVTSAEIRWASTLNGPLQFVLGGFYSEEDKDFVTQVIATGPDGKKLGPFNPGDANTIFGRSKSDDLDQEAVFGEVEWTINDSWSALVGARYYSFEIDSSNQELQPFGGTPSEFPQKFNVDDDKITGKGNVTYRINDDALVYVTVSEGYRPGGTNDVAFVPPGDPPPPAGFGPDELTNYEFGWKLALFDNRMTFNGAVFYIDWQDIQVSTFDPDSPFEVVRNQGDAEITGIEIDVLARPMPGLDLSLVASWQEAEYTSDIPGSDPDTPFALDGDPIPNVPDYQIGATGQYTWNAFGEVEAFVRGEYSYIDDRIILPNNPAADVPLDSFSLVNARIGLQTDRWVLALYGKNLTDEEDSAYDGINSSQDPRAIITARPRTIGLQAQYRFGAD